ncbi:MAG: hypothetical protein LUG16_05330 [Candidatus Gastranaerophilales bacterium]|nr:hypothetical protein [Candidatus Gastranaerophilales bacterium]
MKISPINETLHSKYNKAAAGFNGLWGRTKTATDIDEGLGGTRVRQISYYYPYYDESEENIEKVVENNSYAKIEPIGKSARYVTKECRICRKLPIPEEVYNIYKNYKSTDEMPKVFNEINNEIKDLFINNEPGEQKSALNFEVAKRIITDAEY